MILHLLFIALSLLIILVLIKRYVNGPTYNYSHLCLKGKYAVITGGNSGIGAETAKSLALLGCSVIIGARDQQTAQQTIDSINKLSPGAEVLFIYLDLASRSSIQNFAKKIDFPKLDYLVNNAGLSWLKMRRLTQQGLEMNYGVNHIGHFYLTYLLWNKLNQTNNWRIVNVSSSANTALLPCLSQPTIDFDNINFEHDYEQFLAYSRSKIYNILFTHALAERVNPKKGKIFSLHPGLVRTNILRYLKEGSWQKCAYYIIFIFYPVYWLFTKSAEQGSQTTLYVLLNEEAENGCYYADCSNSVENSCVIAANWNKLWKISQQTLKITFDIFEK